VIAQGITFSVLYIIHILICRWYTIVLLEAGYLKKDSDHIKKAMLLWFTPIMGIFGLWFIYLHQRLIEYWRLFILSHYKPQPLSPQEKFIQTEREILQRVEIIKEKERLNKKQFLTKNKKNKY
jgi:hypothetical protein